MSAFLNSFSPAGYSAQPQPQPDQLDAETAELSGSPLYNTAPGRFQTAWERGNSAVGLARQAAQEHGSIALDQTRQQMMPAWQRAQEQGAAAWEKAPAASELRTAAYEAAQRQGQNVFTGLNNVPEYVKALQEFAGDGKSLAEHKKDAKKTLLKLTKRHQAQVMLYLRESVKDGAVEDPDMPDCVKLRVRTGIDSVWEDLITCVELSLEDQHKALSWGGCDHSFFADLGDSPCPCSPRWWRAKLLYHFLPFDVSMFGQLKDPLYLLMFCLCIITLFGIRVTFCGLVLLGIALGCPPDEYQLVGFILMFKGTQFLSSGVAMAVISAIQYYTCVHEDGTHTCHTTGPGSSRFLLSGTIDVLGSCALTWVAFLLLPFSERAAGTYLLAEDEDSEDSLLESNASGCCRRDFSKGGRISGLLCYDLFCFLFSVSLFVSLTSLKEPLQSTTQPAAQPAGPGLERLHTNLVTWNFGTEFFFARLVYALFSAPFLFFQLPLLNSILTHTVATGYNQQGLCVPYMLKPVPSKME